MSFERKNWGIVANIENQFQKYVSQDILSANLTVLCLELFFNTYLAFSEDHERQKLLYAIVVCGICGDGRTSTAGGYCMFLIRMMLFKRWLVLCSLLSFSWENMGIASHSAGTCFLRVEYLECLCIERIFYSKKTVQVSV